MRLDYPDNISLIDALTSSLAGDNIDDDERAQINAMRKANIEKFIRKNHKNAVCSYTSNGYTTYTTRVDGGKKISAQSVEKLYEKLYEYYSKNTPKETATFENTFEDALNWHSRLNANSQKTVIRNQKLYNARIKGSEFEKKLIKDVNARDIKRFLRSLANKVGPRELSNTKTLINFTFEYACEELEVIPYNPAPYISTKDIRVLPEKRVGEMAYSEEEARTIVTHTINSGNVYQEAICFAFYVGLRFNELSDLKWSDWTGRILTISHGNTESGNLKNGAKSARRLYLCDEALELLNRYRAERPDSEWVFPNQAGNRMMINRFNERLHKICDELGIRYRSSHKIRAYVITQISASGDFESARKFAGHQDYRMTQRYINDCITEANKNASQSLNFGIQTASGQYQTKQKTS